MINSRIKKGFTLIELLVVIAIIGVLASVVLASLNTARTKSRDARRVADVKQIQIALEMYMDSNQEYPENVAVLVTAGLMPSEPKDPSTVVSYPYDNYQHGASQYMACDAATTAGTCLVYHLGATLENTTTSSLQADKDLEIGSKNSATAPDGVSLSPACASEVTAVANTTDKCYDVIP